MALPEVISLYFSRPAVRFAASCVAGCVSALAMAPTSFWFVLFFTLPLFYLALHNTPSRRGAFFAGWLFAFGYYACGWYWIGNALLVEGNPYRLFWPLAVAGLPFALAFYWAFAALAVKAFMRLDRFSGWLGFCATFMAAEWLRGHLFTGFPWNQFGYTWTDVAQVRQIVSVSDVYMLSLLTLMWASASAVLLTGGRAAFRPAGALAIVSFAAVWAFGDFMLWAHPDRYREDVNVQIVQPNIAQADKWDRDKMAEHFMRHVQLSGAEATSEGTTIVVWPETAFTYRYAEDPAAMGAIADALSSHGGPAYLLSGLLRIDRERQIFGNALVMVDAAGVISNVYDKAHLVPFGEYIPFQKYIPLKPVAQFSGFQGGPGLARLPLGERLHYSPLICYEVIFPNKVIDASQPPPDFIVNVTNDAWYGDSPGPYQHFVQAQFRAIESGIPVIRSANTGVSAVITPRGMVAYKSKLQSMEVIKGKLPETVTHYIPKPEYKIAIFLFIIICLILVASIRNMRTANAN